MSAQPTSSMDSSQTQPTPKDYIFGTIQNPIQPPPSGVSGVCAPSTFLEGIEEFGEGDDNVIERISNQDDLIQEQEKDIKKLYLIVSDLTHRVEALESAKSGSPAKSLVESDLPSNRWMRTEEWLTLAGEQALGDEDTRKTAKKVIANTYFYNGIEPPKRGHCLVRDLRAYSTYLAECRENGRVPKGIEWGKIWRANRDAIAVTPESE